MDFLLASHSQKFQKSLKSQGKILRVFHLDSIDKCNEATTVDIKQSLFMGCTLQ